jgi:hypothetical protein
LIPPGVHENVLESRLGGGAARDRAPSRHLVAETLLAETLEKCAEEIATRIELVVIFDDELTDSRDGVRIYEIGEHIVLCALDIELEQIDVFAEEL